VHALRSALAKQLAVDPGELAFGHGSNELIDLLCRAFAGPDDHAVLGAPSFVCYRLSLLAAQVPISEVPLDQGVYWNVDRLLAAVKPNTRFVFVDNPNNPTSTHVPRPALERLLRGLGPNVIPVIDEAYLHFADAPDYVSALDLRDSDAAPALRGGASLRGLHPNLVVLRTFSKAYGLAALRAGYAVGPAWLLRDLERVRVPFNVNGAAQAAALAALDDHAHLRRVVAHNSEQRALLTSELSRLGFTVAPSQANFLCVELPARTQLAAAAMFTALLGKGVIVRPIGGMPRHLRISIGLVDENARLLAALRELLG
jgi:histidinol-phosphate aminotransferase